MEVIVCQKERHVDPILSGLKVSKGYIEEGGGDTYEGMVVDGWLVVATRLKGISWNASQGVER